MCRQKDRANLFAASGDDDGRRAAQEKINLLSRKYKQFSDAAGLPTKKERMSVAKFHSVKTAAELKRNRLTNARGGGIIHNELFRKGDTAKRFSKPIGKKRILEVTLPARKLGMKVIVCDYEDEIYQHLVKNNATASTIYDTVIYRSDATISEVLEEMRHFEQNMEGLNNDKPIQLRTILNEIDAREYILKNAKKYGVPRIEIEDIEKSLKSYNDMLKKYEEGSLQK